MAIFLRYARLREKNESGCTNNPEVYLLKGVTFGPRRQAKSAFAALRLRPGEQFYRSGQ